MKMRHRKHRPKRVRVVTLSKSVILVKWAKRHGIPIVNIPMTRLHPEDLTGLPRLC